MKYNTLQEVFDAVVAHARAQRVAALDRSPATGVSCRYRMTNADGKVLKCFIGALIPDDVFEACNSEIQHQGEDKSSIEGMTVFALWEMKPFRAMFNGDNIAVANLKYLQSVHDTTVHPQNEDANFQMWHEKFLRFANKYELMYKDEDATLMN